MGLLALLCVVGILTSVEVGTISGPMGAVLVVVTGITVFVFSLLSHPEGIMQHQQHENESQSGVVVEGFGVRGSISEHFAARLSRENLLIIIVCVGIAAWLWKHDTASDQAATRVWEAVTEMTFVLSLPQSEREKLNLAMPESLRRKLRIANSGVQP